MSTPQYKRPFSNLSPPNDDIIKGIQALKNENENNKKIATIQKENQANKNEIDALRKAIIDNTKNSVTQNNQKNLIKQTNSIRLIIKKSNIKDISSVNLKNHIDCNILSSKQANIDKETFIIEININDINKCSKDKWKMVGENTNVVVDRYHKNIKTLCINKLNIDESTTLTIEDASINLKKLNDNFFNIRYNRPDYPTLILFETLDTCTNTFTDQSLNIPTLNSKFIIRNFTNLDDYVLQCNKCNRFGHIKQECKQQETSCGRCNSTKCKYSCEKTKAFCVNCQGKHSSHYKGCQSYKNEINKAQERLKKQELHKSYNKVQNLVKDINPTEIKKSYAETTKNTTTLNEALQKLDILEDKIKMNQIRISSLNVKLNKYVSYEDLYTILYESLWLNTHFGYDSYQALRSGLVSTLRGRTADEKNNIERKLTILEKESPIFISSGIVSDSDGFDN